MYRESFSDSRTLNRITGSLKIPTPNSETDFRDHNLMLFITIPSRLMFCFSCMFFVCFCPQGSTESCNTTEEEDMKGRKGTQIFSPVLCMPSALWRSSSRCSCQKSNPSPLRTLPVLQYQKSLWFNNIHLTSVNSRLKYETWGCGDNWDFVIWRQGHECVLPDGQEGNYSKRALRRG